MKETPINDIDSLIIDAVTEKPICFGKDGRFFYLYPPSLGVSLISSKYLSALKFNTAVMAYNEEVEMLRLMHEHRDNILRLIAMHTFKRRSDIMDEIALRNRIDDISGLELPMMVVLTKMIIEWHTWQEKLVKHFDLDKEAKQRKKISDFKEKDSHSLSFGGRSVYGSIIDYAAERYGWQVGYIVWGVSIINLNMMMCDSVTSVFLTKEESSKIGVSTDKIFINADDPKQAERIARMFGKKKKKKAQNTPKETESEPKESNEMQQSSHDGDGNEKKVEE